MTKRNLGKKKAVQDGTLVAFACNTCTSICQSYTFCTGCTTAKPKDNLYLEYYAKNLNQGMQFVLFG